MNFSTYKSNLGDFLATGTTRFPDSQRGLFINLSRKYLLRRYDLPFGESTTAINTVGGTQGYVLPATYSRPVELYYVNTSGSKVLLNQIRGRERFTAAYPDPSKTGAPVDFVTFGSTIYFGPTPDAIYTVYMDYYSLIADLANPNDEATLDINAWEAVLYGALVLAEPYMIEEDRNPAWAVQAQMFEEALVTEYRRAIRSATRIETTEPG